MRFLKELFSKSSLSRAPQSAKLSPTLQAGGAPADCLEGVKTPFQGVFCSFTPRATPSRGISIDISYLLRVYMQKFRAYLCPRSISDDFASANRDTSPAPVSLRLGHAAGLTVHRTVIQYRVAASLPLNGAGEVKARLFSLGIPNKNAGASKKQGRYAPLQRFIWLLFCQKLVVVHIAKVSDKFER